jgi:hypothetical protein
MAATITPKGSAQAGTRLHLPHFLNHRVVIAAAVIAAGGIGAQIVTSSNGHHSHAPVRHAAPAPTWSAAVGPEGTTPSGGPADSSLPAGPSGTTGSAGPSGTTRSAGPSGDTGPAGPGA